MKTKRITAMCLAVWMVVALFSGCGGTTTEGQPAEAVSSAAASSVSENVPAPSADPAPETDSAVEPGAPEAPEAAESGITLPLSETPVTVTLWSTANPGSMNYYETYYDIPTWQESFDRTNIFFESTLVAGNVGNEGFALMAASGDYTDVIGSVNQFYSTGVNGAYNDGIIIDLKPYVDEYAPNFNNALAACNFTKNAINDDGRLLAFVDLVEKKYAETGYVLRQDWLTELGMDVPETYDELYEVLKAFQENYGATMLLPESGLNGTNELISGFGVSVMRTDSSEPQCSYIVEDGKVIPCRTAEGFREYLSLMNKWYEEGLIWADFLSSEVQQAISTRPAKGFDAVMNEAIGCFPAEAEAIDAIASMSTNPEFSLVGMEEPTKTADEMIYSKPEMRYGQINWTISTQCEEELVPYICQYVNYMYSEEGALLSNYGIEGLTFEYNENNEPVFTDLMMNDPENRDFRTLDAVYLMGGLFLNMEEKTNATTSQASMDAANAWRKDIGETNVPSEYASMTAEETTQYYAKYNDIATYFSESVLKFITGTMDPDGSDWDDYVTRMNDMGYEDLTPIVQDMYDRYMAR